MEHGIKDLLKGPGFYAALTLCVLAAGVGGYFLLMREPAEAPPVQPDVQEAAAPAEEEPERYDGGPCPWCGSTEFSTKEQDHEEVILPITTSSGLLKSLGMGMELPRPRDTSII